MKIKCSHCREVNYHKPNCIAYLVARSAALEVSPVLHSDAAETAADDCKFVAIRRAIIQGSTAIASAVSRTMAKRIANALNEYKPNSRGY